MAAEKKRHFKKENLEEIVARLEESICAYRSGGPKVHFNARILDLVDEAVGDDLQWVGHRVEYQALVAATISENSRVVGDFVGDMDEESFSKICTRTGRTFVAISPSEWALRTPLELRQFLQAAGEDDDRLAVRELIDHFKNERSKKN